MPAAGFDLAKARSPKRPGLTLVEVILVIILFVVLIGILLPMIARTRDGSGSRTQTNNNLKQCALGVHNFHDTYRRLPDAFGTDYGLHKEKPASFWVHLLPYVEAENVYKAKDNDAFVAAFQAPSDTSVSGSPGTVSFAANLRVFAHETLDYEKCDEPGTSLTLPADASPLKTHLTLQRVVDGTSNVLMLSTRYSLCAGALTRYSAHPASHGGFFGAGTHRKPASSLADDNELMFQVAPNDNSPKTRCNPTSGIYGHSFGTSGMSTALLDGTVKHIAVTMSPTTYMRALCPGDKKSLDSDWIEN
jgi:type II secretory pathway pseudopilin PulG